MLQIIGWLGCVYLVVKALEIASRDDAYEPSSVDPEKREIKGTAAGAIAIATFSAIGFGVWLYLQGSAVSELPPYMPSY